MEQEFLFKGGPRDGKTETLDTPPWKEIIHTIDELPEKPWETPEMLPLKVSMYRLDKRTCVAEYVGTRP
jgi:hypothetical protein